MQKANIEVIKYLFILHIIINNNKNIFFKLLHNDVT